MRRRFSRSDSAFRTIPAAERAATPLAGKRILVVDDDEDSLQIEAMILAHAGARVVAVSSADEAESAIAEFPPDVVVSDLSMPKRDGFELCRHLRRTTCRSVPILAVTGFATDNDRDRALSAGFSAHLAKPVDPDTLVDSVRALAARSLLDDNTDEPTLPRQRPCATPAR